MSILDTIRAKLRGDASDLDTLHDASRALAAKLATIEAERRELGAAIEATQTAADREAIAAATEAVKAASDAAAREQARLDVLREQARQERIAAGRESFARYRHDLDALAVRFDELASEFSDLERQGRILWAEVEKVLRADLPALRRAAEAERATLVGLGVTDLPEVRGELNEVSLMKKIGDRVRPLVTSHPVRAHGRSVLAMVFGRANI